MAPRGSRDQLLSVNSSPNKKDKKERYSPVPPVQKKCELRHSPGRELDSFPARQPTKAPEAVTRKLLRDTQLT